MPGIDGLIGGRYRLVRQLAAGGMGTVWEGWDERLQRPVAVKQLHLHSTLSRADTEAAVQRTMREARITARLHHPNAVQVFDVVDDEGQPCLIMQYVASTSLQQLVRDRGPLPAAEVARIGTQIAAALAAAHRAGIVHRDVKPGNILIADDGTAKITDFGISHAFDDVSVTSTGMVSGTPAYLAPEVARGAESSPASDVYSLGATLYMAAEGVPPFGSDANPMAMLHRVASGRPNPPSRSGPLAPLLLQMMARDPADRPDMVAVAIALPALHMSGAADEPTELIARAPQLESTTAMPPVLTALPPPSPPVLQPVAERRRSPWVPIVAAAIVVVLAVVLALVLITNRGDNTKNAAAPTEPAATPTRSSAHTSAPPKSSPAPSHPKSTRPSSSPTHNGAVTGSQLAAAVSDYYALVPNDTKAGWDRLSKRYQRDVSQGRGNYNKFWHAIDSVDVSNASGQPPATALCTLTYHFSDGRVTTERTQFGLVREDGIYKINSSEVLSSQTR